MICRTVKIFRPSDYLQHSFRNIRSNAVVDANFIVPQLRSFEFFRGGHSLFSYIQTSRIRLFIRTRSYSSKDHVIPTCSAEIVIATLYNDGIDIIQDSLVRDCWFQLTMRSSWHTRNEGHVIIRLHVFILHRHVFFARFSSRLLSHIPKFPIHDSIHTHTFTHICDRRSNPRCIGNS